MDTREKILSLERAKERLASAISAGESCALAYGWFDVLRSGHAATLERAREGRDLLMVIVHGDSEAHPTVLDESSRSQLVASLRPVDAVVICDQAAEAELRHSFGAVSFVDAEESVAGSVIDEVLRRHGRK
jgi:glycerol-3-phosphate cytidylyltransferase-like family protein